MEKEKIEINEDGSIKGTTFTKQFGGKNYTGEYPSPMYGEETYEEYKDRCKKAVKEGFHLGDLSWTDYSIYCRGFGYFEDVDSNDII